MAIVPISDLSLAQAPGIPEVKAPMRKTPLAVNPFEDVLSRAVDALEGVSNQEYAANALINKFIAGQAELSDVMLATSKMSIAVQLAVTVVTTAVSSFKEITSMQM